LRIRLSDSFLSSAHALVLSGQLFPLRLPFTGQIVTFPGSLLPPPARSGGGGALRMRGWWFLFFLSEEKFFPKGVSEKLHNFFSFFFSIFPWRVAVFRSVLPFRSRGPFFPGPVGRPLFSFFPSQQYFFFGAPNLFFFRCPGFPPLQTRRLRRAPLVDLCSLFGKARVKAPASVFSGRF